MRRFAAGRLDELPDGTVIFGHGIWCGMLQWQRQGNLAVDAGGMLAFRQFQQGLLMANCGMIEIQRRGV